MGGTFHLWCDKKRMSRKKTMTSLHITHTSKGKTECAKMRYWPAELVEHSDVGIHVVDVVGVGGVLDDVPLLWFGALSGEHVTTVLGLIVHTVEACHLHTRMQTLSYTRSRGCSGLLSSWTELAVKTFQHLWLIWKLTFTVEVFSFVIHRLCPAKSVSSVLYTPLELK